MLGLFFGVRMPRVHFHEVKEKAGYEVSFVDAMGMGCTYCRWLMSFQDPVRERGTNASQAKKNYFYYFLCTHSACLCVFPSHALCTMCPLLPPFPDYISNKKPALTAFINNVGRRYETSVRHQDASARAQAASTESDSSTGRRSEGAGADSGGEGRDGDARVRETEGVGSPRRRSTSSPTLRWVFLGH